VKLTEQYIKFEYLGGGIDTIEKAARTCYKSEGKIEEGSANEIIERLIKNKSPRNAGVRVDAVQDHN